MPVWLYILVPVHFIVGSLWSWAHYPSKIREEWVLMPRERFALAWFVLAGLAQYPLGLLGELLLTAARDRRIADPEARKRYPANTSLRPSLSAFE